MATVHRHAVAAHVASKVRALRKSKGLSQTDVAEALGITFQQIQKYENGSNRISVDALYSIARLLDAPVSYFFPEDADEAPLPVVNRDLAREVQRLYESVERLYGRVA